MNERTEYATSSLPLTVILCLKILRTRLNYVPLVLFYLH